MAENKNILDRISPFSLLLTLVILLVIGTALIPLVDVGSSPKPRQGKTLTISYSWRNASPKVVEQEVTSKIEGLVSAVKGVGEVSSVSNFGSGRVTVVLKKEADVSEEYREKLRIKTPGINRQDLLVEVENFK